MENNTNQQQESTSSLKFNRKEFKRQAKQALSGRWKVPVLATLIHSAICIIIALCLYPWDFAKMSLNPDAAFYVGTSDFLLMFLSSMFKAILFEAFFLVGFPVLLFALNWMYHALYKNAESVTFNTFINGFTYWKKAIPAYLWQTLWLYLWCLAAYAIFFVGVLIIVLLTTVFFSFANPVVEIIVGICSFILVLGVVSVFMGIILNRTYAYSMTMYIISDNPNIGAIKALNLSKTITKGYKFKLFVLEFSFIGWELLGILSLGIGFLWISPYITLTIVNAYHRLKAIAIASGVISPEEIEPAIAIEASTVETPTANEETEPKAIESSIENDTKTSLKEDSDAKEENDFQDGTEEPKEES